MARQARLMRQVRWRAWAAAQAVRFGKALAPHFRRAAYLPEAQGWRQLLVLLPVFGWAP
ncbi:MAG: hypothetical protein NT049_17470 [Planctomycetota bacterium]|nr:hypothetical protein [Planctomycetota bacterium]